MEKQGNITETKSLTVDVAKHICEEIMGFEYSHHDNDRTYEDYGDKVPQIYFYQGMSPSIMKINTVNGDVRYGITIIDDLYDLTIETKKLMIEKNININLPDRNPDVTEFRVKGELVKEYLINNNWL